VSDAAPARSDDGAAARTAPAPTLQVTITPVLSYALAYNHIAVVHRVDITNPGPAIGAATLRIQVEDAAGPRVREQYLKYAAQVFSAARPPDGPEPATAFINLLLAQQARIVEQLQEELTRKTAELEQQFQDKKDLKWYLDKAEGRAKREEARRRRVAAQDALDLLVSWVRDLWVVASGASDVLWNSDHRDALVEAVVATPEHYARLLGVAARTRKDLNLNIDQKLALQAMFARFEEVSTSA